MSYAGNICHCQYKLSFSDKQRELNRIIEKRIKLHPSTQRVIFLCFAREARVGLNSIGILLLRGFNIFCFCEVRKRFAFSVKLAPPPLCTLNEIPCRFNGTQAFSVKTFSHPTTCPDSGLPSLRELSYLNLYMAQINNNALENLEKQGIVPLWIRKSLPESICIPPLIDWSYIVPLYLPYSLPSTAVCTNVEEHTKKFH